MSIEAMKQALINELRADPNNLNYTRKIRDAAWDLLEAIAEAEKQEPVGEIECIDIDEDGQPSAWVKLYDNVALGDLLYNHPQPKRDEAPAKAVEWVGLTDDEKESIINKKVDGAYLTVMETIELTEAKLKEKNT